VQPCRGVSPLVGEVEISNLGAELVEYEDVAGADISMNNGGLHFLVEVLQASRGAVSDLDPLRPVEDGAGFGALNPFLPCTTTRIDMIDDRIDQSINLHSPGSMEIDDGRRTV